MTLVIAETDSGSFVGGETIVTPAGATTPLVRLHGAHLRIAMVQALEAELATAPDPQCNAMGFANMDVFAARAKAAAAADAGHPSDTAAAAEELAATQRIAQLDFESYADATNFAQHNAVAELIRQQTAESNPAAAARQSTIETEQTAISSMLEMSALNGATVSTYLGQLDDDAKLLSGPATVACQWRKSVADTSLKRRPKRRTGTR
jgi:hypothetical protein